MAVEYHDLRGYVDLVKQRGQYLEIDNADWNLEIGALTEATAEHVADPPMMMFDNIKGHEKGFRVMSLGVASKRNAAISMGLDPNKTKLGLVRDLVRTIKNIKPMPPRFVNNGPVMENVMEGDAINILKFPSLISHSKDGGRYIGTGDSLINADPETGYVNVGTYRMQVHDEKTLGLWMSPGQQGREICARYWRQGKACPVVAIFGGDPLVFHSSCVKFPWGKPELEYAGGWRGQPIDVIKGPITGLPIPIYSEVVVEGEVPPPDVEAREEGPFGEWPGYYSGGTTGTGVKQPIIKIKAVYYRHNPILWNQAPMWLGAPTHGISQRAGLVWDQIEAAGVPNVVGVYFHTGYLLVVAIKQAYAGHAKQAAMAAMATAAGARNGRYVVVVDEDIDPTNLKEVVWAMQTRVDPVSDIETIAKCWSTPLDPRMPPENRIAKDHTNSRAVFYAVRPWAWRNQFPIVNRTERELLSQVMNKYRGKIAFPEGL